MWISCNVICCLNWQPSWVDLRPSNDPTNSQLKTTHRTTSCLHIVIVTLRHVIERVLEVLFLYKSSLFITGNQRKMQCSSYGDCSNCCSSCVIFAYLEALHRKSLLEVSSLHHRLGKTAVSRLCVEAGLLFDAVQCRGSVAGCKVLAEP